MKVEEKVRCPKCNGTGIAGQDDTRAYPCVACGGKTYLTVSYVRKMHDAQRLARQAFKAKHG
jgi:DnaJ-class molecular chaperone